MTNNSSESNKNSDSEINKNMTTDTPRTDAIQFQKKPISLSIENEMLRSLSRQLERELAALQAEVEELKQQKRNCLEIIDDDAKERSELKAEVERLKQALAFIANDDAAHGVASYYRSVAYGALNPTNQ